MQLRKANFIELAKLVGADYVGDDIEIDCLNLSNRATNYNAVLSYVTNVDICDCVLENEKVKAIIANQSDKDDIIGFFKDNNREISIMFADNAEETFYDLHNKLYTTTDFYDKKEWEPQIGNNCQIAPNATIEKGVIIEDNVEIGYNTVIRKGSVLKDNVHVGCNCVIGSEGFQAIMNYHTMVKHIGGTILQEGVYIGDNTTICNSLFEGNTVIGAYSKIDNHVQVAHNCKCGNHCVITPSCVLLGTVTLGDRVWVAPNTVFLNKVIVGDDTFVGSMSYVNMNLKEKSNVFGIPARKIMIIK